MSFAKNKSRALKKFVRLMAPVAMASALATNAGCATVQEMNAESKPYGEQLKERVAQWDEWCKKEKLGPYLEDPRKKRIGTCDFLALKDKRWDPNADEFSRYAHSIKLPPPHDKPQAQYKEEMTSKEYFKELCAKEAGQWVFKKVEGVEGVFQVRPYVPTSPKHDLLIPNTEEPFIVDSNTQGLWAAMGSKDPFSQYRFFEYRSRDAGGGNSIVRYYRSLDYLKQLDSGKQIEWKSYYSIYQVPYITDSVVRSKYAFVWRGIFRNEFAKHGIEGGELMVIDYRTREVLALVRNFFSYRLHSTVAGSTSKDVDISPCANYPTFGHFSNFIQQTLIPIN